MNLIQLDLGRSLLTNRPVLLEIATRLPATLELTLAAMMIATIIGVSLGSLAAAKKQRLWDTISMMIALAGVSIPVFWLGLEFIYFFSFKLNLFPSFGRGQLPYSITGLFVLDSILTGNPQHLFRALSHLALPALTLGLLTSALIARMTRSSLIQVFEHEFMRVAQAIGVSRRQYWKHAFAAGFAPIVTVMGLQMGTLLGGAILTEHVFSWPGLGSYMVQAVFARDFPSIQALVALSALFLSG